MAKNLSRKKSLKESILSGELQISNPIPKESLLLSPKQENVRRKSVEDRSVINRASCNNAILNKKLSSSCLTLKEHCTNVDKPHYQSHEPTTNTHKAVTKSRTLSHLSVIEKDTNSSTRIMSNKVLAIQPTMQTSSTEPIYEDVKELKVSCTRSHVDQARIMVTPSIHIQLAQTTSLPIKQDIQHNVDHKYMDIDEVLRSMSCINLPELPPKPQHLSVLCPQQEPKTQRRPPSLNSLLDENYTQLHVGRLDKPSTYAAIQSAKFRPRRQAPRPPPSDYTTIGQLDHTTEYKDVHAQKEIKPKQKQRRPPPLPPKNVQSFKEYIHCDQHSIYAEIDSNVRATRPVKEHDINNPLYKTLKDTITSVSSETTAMSSQLTTSDRHVYTELGCLDKPSVYITLQKPISNDKSPTTKNMQPTKSSPKIIKPHDINIRDVHECSPPFLQHQGLVLKETNAQNCTGKPNIPKSPRKMLGRRKTMNINTRTKIGMN